VCRGQQRVLYLHCAMFRIEDFGLSPRRQFEGICRARASFGQSNGRPILLEFGGFARGRAAP
jgi:hypothetical protein